MTRSDQTIEDGISNEIASRPAESVMSGRGRMVRHLEWQEGEGQLDGQKVWSSGDPWVFWIVKNPGSKFIWCENFNIEGWCPASPVRGSFDSLDEAKAAAQTDFDQRVLAALVRPPATADHAQRSQGPMSFFSANVDAWGAAEWFDRMAKAIRQQDEAVLAKNDLLFETCRNVAASSAMRLVRDYEKQVRDALAAAARSPNASGNPAEPDMADPIVNGIMGAARLVTHDHETAYRITSYAMETIGGDLKRLRAQVEDAQERFAKLAEDAAKGWVNGEAGTFYGQAYQAACRHVAEAIRAHKPSPTEGL